MDIEQFYVSPKVSIGTEKFTDLQFFQIANQISTSEFQLKSNSKVFFKTAPRLLVLGRGGSGKSILMKWIWLRNYNNVTKYIPIFVELRKINELSTIDLKKYIYVSAFNTSLISQSDFEEILLQGRVLFIFDGYDEVLNERKEVVERQINALGYEYLNCPIVVSARDDERLNAWQLFSTFRMAKLEQSDTKEIVYRLPISEEEKSRFIKEFSGIIAVRHRSFLENPLLVNMMVLTFMYHQDISEKFSEFYEQAYEALYKKHDLTKEGFRRDFYLKVSMHEFKDLFAAFCFFTYKDQKTDFSDADLSLYIAKAFSICELQGNAHVDDFKRDMIESVCVLVKEGLNTEFVHRSFQEYFASIYVAKLDEDVKTEIIKKFSFRMQDNFIYSLNEIDKNYIEKQVFIPVIHEFEALLSINSSAEFFFSYVGLLNLHIYILPVENGTESFWMRSGIGEVDMYRYGVLWFIGRIYAKDMIKYLNSSDMLIDNKNEIYWSPFSRYIVDEKLLNLIKNKIKLEVKRKYRRMKFLRAIVKFDFRIIEINLADKYGQNEMVTFSLDIIAEIIENRYKIDKLRNDLKPVFCLRNELLAKSERKRNLIRSELV